MDKRGIKGLLMEMQVGGIRPRGARGPFARLGTCLLAAAGRAACNPVLASPPATLARAVCCYLDSCNLALAASPSFVSSWRLAVPTCAALPASDASRVLEPAACAASPVAAPLPNAAVTTLALLPAATASSRVVSSYTMLRWRSRQAFTRASWSAMWFCCCQRLHQPVLAGVSSLAPSATGVSAGMPSASLPVEMSTRDCSADCCQLSTARSSSTVSSAAPAAARVRRRRCRSLACAAAGGVDGRSTCRCIARRGWPELQQLQAGLRRGCRRLRTARV